MARSGVATNSMGWQLKNGNLQPVLTRQAPAPEKLLTLISCNCKSGCERSCGCRKAGLICTALCGHCRGNGCSNSDSPIVCESEMDGEHIFDEKSEGNDFISDSLILGNEAVDFDMPDEEFSIDRNYTYIIPMSLYLTKLYLYYTYFLFIILFFVCLCIFVYVYVFMFMFMFMCLCLCVCLFVYNLFFVYNLLTKLYLYYTYVNIPDEEFSIEEFSIEEFSIDSIDSLFSIDDQSDEFEFPSATENPLKRKSKT